MFAIRNLLDFLADHNPDAIDRLCDLRGLSGRGRAAKCESLARSYRGDHGQLFEELRKDELVALLDDPTEIDGEEFYLPSASSHSKADLVRIALRLFRDERPPRELARFSERHLDADHDFSVLELVGAIRTISVRHAPLFISWIAPLLRIPCRSVQRKLLATHVLDDLETVFAEQWPIRVGSAPCDVLGALAAGSASQSPSLVRWISDLAGVEPRQAHEALQTVHGWTRVDDVFPELIEKYPADKDDENEEDDDEADSTDVEDLADLNEADLLGAVPASAARRSATLLEWIAPSVGIPPPKLTRLVSEAHGNTLLRNILEPSWPIDVPKGAATILGTLRVSAVRRAPTLIEWVARLTGESFDSVGEAVDGSDGNTRVVTIFPSLNETQTRARTGADHDRTVLSGSGKSESTSKAPAKGKRLAKAGTAKPGLLPSRYQLGRFLAEGGFGEAYEATDKQAPARGPLVVKFSKATDGTYVDALQREFALAANLTHPNICKYWDYGVANDGRLFVVMQHCGDSVTQVMVAEGALDVGRALEIVSSVAAALDYAHGRGIVHLDINPGNVLVEDTPRGELVRIADFGVSAAGTRALNSRGRSTVHVPVSGHHPGYAAPEVRGATGRPKSDQYSLAKLFCSMLEGEVFDEPYAVRDFARLTRAQNVAIRKAASHEPTKRFNSCGEFAAALRAGGR